MSEKSIFEVSFQTILPEGYIVYFRFQYDTKDELLTDVINISSQLGKIEFKPAPLRFGKESPKKEPKYVEEKICPKCSNKLIYTESINPKAPHIRCSSSKWDFIKKISTGCDYVEWKQNGEATLKQKDFLAELQSAGKIELEVDIDKLSFKEASDMLRIATGK